MYVRQLQGIPKCWILLGPCTITARVDGCKYGNIQDKQWH